MSRGRLLTTEQRGPYNYDHVKERRRRIQNLRDGDPCCLCGGPLFKADARNIHLDHHPEGEGYRGLAHALCNSVDGARRGGAVTAARYGTYRPRHRPAPQASRNW